MSLWPWSRHKDSTASPEAIEAVQRAHEHLGLVRAQEPEVRALSESLKRQRQANHFGQRLEAAYLSGLDRGGRP